MDPASLALSLATGLALAAAAGFRAFVPLLATGLAIHFGVIEPASGFGWLGEPVTLLALLVATLLEVGAYYLPGLDHALDIIAAPLALAAGIVVAASVMAELPPWLRWLAAIVAGGGATAASYWFTTLTRAKSGVATGGLANPLVSTAELAGSVLLAALALLAPVIAILALAWIFLAVSRRRRRRRGSG